MNRDAESSDPSPNPDPDPPHIQARSEAVPEAEDVTQATKRKQHQLYMKPVEQGAYSTAVTATLNLTLTYVEDEDCVGMSKDLQMRMDRAAAQLGPRPGCIKAAVSHK